MSESIEARLNRELAERRACERQLLGVMFQPRAHAATFSALTRYEVVVLDQARRTVDARRESMHPGDNREHMILGMPIDDLIALQGGCSCGQHLRPKPENKVEPRHRSAAYALLATGKNFEIWWREGAETLRRNAPNPDPTLTEELAALDRMAQQIANLDPNGEPG